MKEGVFSNWLSKEREKEKDSLAEPGASYKKSKERLYEPPRGERTKTRLRKPMKQD